MLVFAANFDNWPKLWVGIVDKNFPGLLVTLDFATFFYEDIVDEDDDGNFARHLYAYGWLGACAILAAVFGIVWGCLAKYPIGRVIFTRAALTIGHIMMIPIGLGLMPMALCTYDGCWSGVDVNQMIILILSMAVFLIYLVFLPYYNLQHVKKHLISQDPVMHEKFIQLREIEFVLQISSTWLTEQHYIYSNYRRTYWRCYHKGIYQIFILILIVVHAALGQSLWTKMMIYTIMAGSMAAYTSALPVYRCLTSSWLYALTWWMVAANSFMGLLRAVDYKSDSMVDSNFAQVISMMNIVIIIFAFFLIFSSVVFCLRWPTNINSIKELNIAYRDLLVDLRNAQKMILTLRGLASYQFVRAPPIEKMLDLLRDHYVLLYKEKHSLQFTVLEQMDALSYLLDEVVQNTLLPCERLEKNFPLLLEVGKRRGHNQILMNPLKRRILLKLYFLRIFTKNLNLHAWSSGDQFNMIGKNRKEMGLADFAKENTETMGDINEQILVSSDDDVANDVANLEQLEETLMDPLMAQVHEAALTYNVQVLENLREQAIDEENATALKVIEDALEAAEMNQKVEIDK